MTWLERTDLSLGARAHTHAHPDSLIRQLGAMAYRLRIDALKMVHRANSGHLGGAFSVAEVMACLYWHQLKLNPANPAWAQRDRFLLSKGHASAIYYAALARRGFFPVEELTAFRSARGRLSGHPERAVPGVEMTGGPLGHGIAVGAGMALALARRSRKPTAAGAPSAYAAPGVYVLLGDGELDAGIVWEGAAVAAKHRLGNLVAIVDVNGVQQTGATCQVMPLGDLAGRWRACGWTVLETDGHDILTLLSALDQADQVHGAPVAVLARTTKGRGVGFMEHDHRWHGGGIDARNFELALAELSEGLAAWTA